MIGRLLCGLGIHNRHHVSYRSYTDMQWSPSARALIPQERGYTIVRCSHCGRLRGERRTLGEWFDDLLVGS